MSAEGRCKDGGRLTCTLLLASVVILSVAGAVQAAPTPAPGVRFVDHRADALLKRMSDTLRKHRRFSVVIDEASDVAVKAGRNVHFETTSTITVERPNKLRMDRRGDLVDASLLYDGKTVTLWSRRTNFFATTPVPPTLDQMLEVARERIEIDIPAADLLGSDPARALGRSADSIQYAGRETVHGVDCQHLVFKGLETHRELWIEDGDRSLPCKYAVVAKAVTGSPTYSAEFRNWSFEATAGPDPFTFEPPPGASRIPLLEIIETLPRPQIRER
jgi:hypothetical protein